MNNNPTEPSKEEMESETIKWAVFLYQQYKKKKLREIDEKKD